MTSSHPRVQPLSASHRPTRAEVDLGALARNYHAVSAAVGVPILAVVKADAYGHGVVPVARRLAAEGAFGFGVALAEEGLQLRAEGIGGTVLVLNGVYGKAHREVADAGLTPVVYDLGTVEAFAALGTPVGVHLKVDTGMGRLGVGFRVLPVFLEQLTQYPSVNVDGVMTHLASADSDPELTQLQLERFDAAVALVRAAGYAPRYLHAANSAGALLHPGSRHDFVRTGIALYGAVPFDPPPDVSLVPTLRLRSEIVRIHDAQDGDSIGYDATYIVDGERRIATLPIGYGDGLVWRTDGPRWVLVRGVRCPIVGRVSMDLTTVDVSNVSEVAVGDEAVLLGEQAGARLGVRELARGSGTITYDVLTSISRRVPRAYIDP